jgi:hypothetical protein
MEASFKGAIKSRRLDRRHRLVPLPCAAYKGEIPDDPKEYV